MTNRSTKSLAGKAARKNVKAKKKNAVNKNAVKKGTVKKSTVKKPALKKAAAKNKIPAKPAKPKKTQTRAPENVQEHIGRIMNIDKKMVGKKKWLYQFMHRYFDPHLIGLENIDKHRPTLFVANHSLLGVDGAIAPLEILTKTGVLPRLFTDGRAMQSPLADFVIELGQIWADPQVCDVLMEAGESLMVFPGGFREGTKKRDELYKLLWEGRTGFVKAAIKHGYTITPFASVGLDDAWDIIWDRDDIAGSRLEKFMQLALPDVWDSEQFPPIPRGLGLTLFPRPERCYMAFAKPIDMQSFAGKENDQSVLTHIKDQVQAEVDSLIKETMLVRARQRSTIGWLRKRLTRL